MKFITVALLSLIAVSVNADLTSCVQAIPIPCSSSTNIDVSCSQALSQYYNCVANNSCASNVNNLSDYSKCIKNCAPSSNTEVQEFANKYAACLYENIIGYTFAFLAIIAFMF
ncbi:hypothetical protein ABPG74_018523 [Tetrahymena malaccensis]